MHQIHLLMCVFLRFYPINFVFCAPNVKSNIKCPAWVFVLRNTRSCLRNCTQHNFDFYILLSLPSGDIVQLFQISLFSHSLLNVSAGEVESRTLFGAEEAFYPELYCEEVPLAVEFYWTCFRANDQNTHRTEQVCVCVMVSLLVFNELAAFRRTVQLSVLPSITFIYTNVHICQLLIQ